MMDKIRVFVPDNSNPFCLFGITDKLSPEARKIYNIFYISCKMTTVKYQTQKCDRINKNVLNGEKIPFFKFL